MVVIGKRKQLPLWLRRPQPRPVQRPTIIIKKTRAVIKIIGGRKIIKKTVTKIIKRKRKAALKRRSLVKKGNEQLGEAWRGKGVNVEKN